MEQVKSYSDGLIKIKIISFLLACIVLFSGMVVLFGWILHLDVLKSMYSGLETMKANSAICFILIGVILTILHVRNYWTTKIDSFSLIVKVLAAIVFLIALLTFVEYLLKLNFGIDQLLFMESAKSGVYYPGRMAINSALSFMIVAISFFYVDSTEGFSEHISQILAFLAGFISLVSIFGYLAGEKVFAGGIPGYNLMSVNTAVIFILIALSLFLLQPNKSLTAAIIGNNPGGTLLRYTLLSFFGVICLLTWGIILGEKKSYFSAGFAIVLFSSAEVFVFIIILWIISQKLNTIEYDALTNLRNRRSLYSILAQEIIRAIRYHRPLTMLFLDIDDFKLYNDAYGHQFGDKVLIKLADLIRNELRQTDFSFRYGGDEFLILLPETSKEDAYTVAERLRQKFSVLNFAPTSNLTTATNTLSIGLAQYYDNYSAKQFVEYVDKAMYQGKKQGKNQVSIL